MTKKVFLLLVAFAEVAIMAQEGMHKGHISDYVSLDTIIAIHNEKTGAYTNLTYSKWGDEVVFTNFSARDLNDTITVYRVNSSAVSLDTIRLYEKGLCKAMRSYLQRNLPSLIYSPKTILVNYADKISVFTKQNNHSYQKEKTYRFEEDFSDMKLLNDSLVAGVNFNYSHPGAFTLFLFNINNGQIVKKIVPEYNESSLLLSFFGPYDIMDVKNGMIALTDRGRYIVRFYNENLTCVDSIVYGGRDWRTLSEDIVNRAMALDKYNAAEIIDLLITEYDSVDNIQHLFFIDGDKIAVTHRRKKCQEVSIDPYMDIWHKTPTKWELIEKSLFDDGYLIKDSVFRRNMKPIGFGSGDKICFMANGKIVVLTKNGNGIDNPVGMPMREMGRKEYDYLMDNDHYVQCLFFSQTFNTLSK